MDKQPLVSVILPVYNGEAYLYKALKSLIDQTYNNLEILVLNDGSTDASVAIAQSFKDKRIKIIDNKTNLGLVNILNQGVSLASGAFIARMDADDICLPQRIKEQVEFLLANKDVALIDTIMELIDEEDRPLNAYNSTKISEKQIKQTLPFDNCMGHSSVMIPQEVYTRYRYRKVVHEDYDLWLRLLNDGKRICKINKPLLLYRIHSSSYMAKIPRRRITMADTKMFYYGSLKTKDKFKKMNLIVLFSGLVDYARGWLKWLILNLKK